MNIVVLDTNILISAIHNPTGIYAKIVNMVFSEEIELRYSQNILNEYEEVLSRTKHGLSQKAQKAFLNNILDVGKNLDNPMQYDISIRDAKDQIFYDVAKDSKAIY